MDRPKLIVSFALTVIVLLLIADVRVSAAKDDMNKQKPGLLYFAADFCF